MNRFKNELDTQKTFTEREHMVENIVAFLRDAFYVLLVACVILFAYLAITSTKVSAHDIDSPVIENGKQPTHYLMDFYAPNEDGVTTRYVVTVKIAMFDLVAGTARDFGIKPPHLQAICLKEGVEFVGEHAFACSPTAAKPDEGAIGAFQIRAKYHGISVEDAQHPYFSARWTAERMLRYGYKENPYHAIGRHNGGGARARKYAGEVWQIAKTMRIIKELSL